MNRGWDTLQFRKRNGFHPHVWHCCPKIIGQWSDKPRGKRLRRRPENFKWLSGVAKALSILLIEVPWNRVYRWPLREYSKRLQLEMKRLKSADPIAFKNPLFLSYWCKVSLKSPTMNIGVANAACKIRRSSHSSRLSCTVAGKSECHLHSSSDSL